MKNLPLLRSASQHSLPYGPCLALLTALTNYLLLVDFWSSSGSLLRAGSLIVTLLLHQTGISYTLNNSSALVNFHEFDSQLAPDLRTEFVMLAFSFEQGGAQEEHRRLLPEGDWQEELVKQNTDGNLMCMSCNSCSKIRLNAVV